MNPIEIWYLIERGHKPAEFLAGFVGDKAVWSRDRCVAMCWLADADAKAVLAHRKGTQGFLGASIGIVSPTFARNLQSPPPPPAVPLPMVPPPPTPAKGPHAKPKKASKAPARKPPRKAL